MTTTSLWRYGVGMDHTTPSSPPSPPMSTLVACSGCYLPCDDAHAHTIFCTGCGTPFHTRYETARACKDCFFHAGLQNVKPVDGDQRGKVET